MVAGLTSSVFKERLGVDSMPWWGMTETVSHGIYSDGQVDEFEGNIGRVAPSTTSRSSMRRAPRWSSSPIASSACAVSISMRVVKTPVR
jgi:hypothetical protein